MPQADSSAAPTQIAPATELALRDQNGVEHKLAEFRGHNVVVYFYPADDTPGCTVEGKEFRELHDQFTACDTVVLGVSTDSVERHRAFAEKHAFPFLLLADHKGELAQAFGVLENGRAARTTFVLDQESRVRRAFHEVTPRGHAQQVLNFVRSLIEARRMLGG